jgi:hypothetical protein
VAIQDYETYIERWKDPLYRGTVLATGEEGLSDGCSGVPDFFWPICVEHDIHYWLHEDFYTGDEITQENADLFLMWGIQFHSWFGRRSPMARWRYRALSSKKGLALGREPWKTGPERLVQRLADGRTQTSSVEEDLGA